MKHKALSEEAQQRLIRHLGDGLYGTRGDRERRQNLRYLEDWLKKVIGGYGEQARKKATPAIRSAWNAFDKQKDAYLKQLKKENKRKK